MLTAQAKNDRIISITTKTRDKLAVALNEEKINLAEKEKLEKQLDGKVESLKGDKRPLMVFEKKIDGELSLQDDKKQDKK